MHSETAVARLVQQWFQMHFLDPWWRNRKRHPNHHQFKLQEWHVEMRWVVCV